MTRGLARSWLLAHLIAAVLVETSRWAKLSMPPGGHAHPAPRVRPACGVPGRLRIGGCSARSLPRGTGASVRPHAIANRRLTEAPRRRRSQAREAQFALS